MIFTRQLAYWGEEKQELLSKAAVLVAGVGGLGCLLSELLVRAGVGKLYICDKGIIDEPDLNRQLFYTIADIGKKKIEVASKKLNSIHGLTDIIPLDRKVQELDDSIYEECNGVAECLDNFPSRFDLWDKIPEGKFYVHAGVERFYGQIVSLNKESSPPLNEIFANYKTPDGIIPVSGVSAAVLSSLAATEVIHNIFGAPQLLNTLLMVDLSDFSFSKIELK